MKNEKNLDFSQLSSQEMQKVFFAEVLSLEEGQKLIVKSKSSVHDLLSELDRRASGEYFVNLIENGPSEWRFVVKKAGGDCCGCCCGD
jgi:uncharacterized protein (DUF2249 family)